MKVPKKSKYSSKVETLGGKKVQYSSKSTLLLHTSASGLYFLFCQMIYDADHNSGGKNVPEYFQASSLYQPLSQGMAVRYITDLTRTFLEIFNSAQVTLQERCWATRDSSRRLVSPHFPQTEAQLGTRACMDMAFGLIKAR